ncbi:MAG: hypothetical protein COA79_22735 [Planctomycetota bacterium]|nr:MAG: hypothetical protein COA79_22735 [Planctomycetota bacterium]
MTQTINYSYFLILCLLVSGCVSTTTRNSWNSNTTAIANKIYNGAWEFYSHSQGKDTVIRLYHKNSLMFTDGRSYYEIVFQLPSKVQTGKTYLLSPVPATRPAKKVGENDRLADMREGEITAFRYGNPVMGWMKVADEASVKIISIGKIWSVIRLKLKSKLEPKMRFDFDQSFKVKMNYKMINKK